MLTKKLLSLLPAAIAVISIITSKAQAQLDSLLPIRGFAIAAPPAVINAITDALGHEDLQMPATPQNVWRAAQKATMPMAAE